MNAGASTKLMAQLNKAEKVVRQLMPAYGLKEPFEKYKGEGKK